MKHTCLGLLAAVLLAVLLGSPAQAGDVPSPVLVPGRWPTADLDLGLVSVGGGLGVPFSKRVGAVVGVDTLQLLGLPIPWSHRPWPFPVFTFRAALRVGLGRRSHLDVGPHMAIGPDGVDGGPFPGDLGLGGPFRSPGTPLVEPAGRVSAASPPDGPFEAIRWGGQVDLRLGRTRPLLGPRLTVDWVRFAPSADQAAKGRVVVLFVPLMARWVD